MKAGIIDSLKVIRTTLIDCCGGVFTADHKRVCHCWEGSPSYGLLKRISRLVTTDDDRYAVHGTALVVFTQTCIHSLEWEGILYQRRFVAFQLRPMCYWTSKFYFLILDLSEHVPCNAVGPAKWHVDTVKAGILWKWSESELHQLDMHSKNLTFCCHVFSILAIRYIYFVSVIPSACSVSSKYVTVELPMDEKENPATGGGMDYWKAYLDLLLSRTLNFPLSGIWLCIQANVKEMCLLKCTADYST